VILDLCGEWFTSLGRELILRRLATEAHGADVPRLVVVGIHVSHEPDGVDFARTHLRPAGARAPHAGAPRELSEAAHSRVAPHTDLAWQNLAENITQALLPDGGYLEGPGYFTWTARQAILGAQLYARGRGRNPREFVSPSLLQTAGWPKCSIPPTTARK